jgi:RsiW-degrading membrane proteinase PrsW (M82 family)
MCHRCLLVQPPANYCRNCGQPAPGDVPPSFIPKQRDSFIRAVGLSIMTMMIACMLCCVLLNTIGSTGFDLDVIALSLTAAIVPTVLYGSLVVWLDRNEPESWELLGFAFLWGAVVAIFFALVLNSAAWSIFTLASDASTGDILTAVVAAPLVEESAKGLLVLLVLVFKRRHIDGMLDGLVLGALVGLGFAMTENITYFGITYRENGADQLGALFVIRSVINGLGHAVWTSFTGAAVGWARARHGRGVLRAIVPPVGWTGAVVGHGVWNLGASIVIGILAIGFERVYLLDDWQALLIAGTIGGLPFSVPPLLMIYIIARLAREHEAEVVRRYLPVEVALGMFSAEEWEIVTNGGKRRAALDLAAASGGRIRRRQQQRLFEIATKLSFFHYHALKGERPDKREVIRAEQLRWQLGALRWAMLNSGR